MSEFVHTRYLDAMLILHAVQEVDLGMLFPSFQCSVINLHDYISEEALEKMGSDKRKRQKVLFEIINTEKTYGYF